MSFFSKPVADLAEHDVTLLFLGLCSLAFDITKLWQRDTS